MHGGKLSCWLFEWLLILLRWVIGVMISTVKQPKQATSHAYTHMQHERNRMFDKVAVTVIFSASVCC
jgi:hypothetical protein